MNEKIRRPSAPPGNQNAAGPRKPEKEKSTSILYMRCRREDKARWVRAAKRRPLAEWVTEALNKAANSPVSPES